MKKIEVTYEAMYPLETGDYEQGEAAFILPMTDELAAEYLAGRATDRGAVNLVETALEAVEVMVDPFAGSCTTAVACIRTGRRYVCFEVSETYAAAGQARVDKLLAERQARNTKK